MINFSAFSTERFASTIPDFRYSGATTDSGGGGTGKSLGAEMMKQGLCKNDGSYLLGYCCLHTLQLTLSNSIQNRIGVGKLENRNAMQLIHSIYDLQAAIEIDLWKKLYFKAAEEIGETVIKFKKIAAPIVTRWWTVGAAATDFLEKFPIFIQLCKNIRNVYTSENARNKIASSILSLSKEPVIISDVNLISCYHNAFLDKNFAWLQKGDKEIGNSPGFLGRHMLARYYLMNLQLKKLMNCGWKTVEEMKKFVLGLEGEEMKTEMEDPSNPSQRITYKIFQETKANHFFSDALRALEKHYMRYCEELLFLSLYGETFLTKIVSMILLNKDIVFFSEKFSSETHGVQIDMNDLAMFVKERITLSDQLSNFHIQKIPKCNLQKLAGKNQSFQVHLLQLLCWLFLLILRYYFNQMVKTY